MKYPMKIWQNLKGLLFKSVKTPKVRQIDKQKQATDYVDQLLKHFENDAEIKEHGIGHQIGSSLNYLELSLLKAKLMTGQQYVTDELLIELEKLLWTKI